MADNPAPNDPFLPWGLGLLGLLKGLFGLVLGDLATNLGLLAINRGL